MAVSGMVTRSAECTEAKRKKEEVGIIFERINNTGTKLTTLDLMIAWTWSEDFHLKEKMDEIRRLGWDIRPAATDPNRIKKLKYSHWEDRLKYDILDDVNKLTMPVLMIVGSLDDGALPKHQKILYNALPGPKEFHIIEGGPHTFVDEDHLKQIYEIFNAWIKKTNT